MNDKKNIDRLFQEKFKNFEATPDDAVWKKIQAHQNKDRKRVLVIPFWYRIAGVAALIAIILTVGSVFKTDPTTDAIVITEDLENTDIKSSEKQHNKDLDNRIVDKTKNSTPNYTDTNSENNSTNREGITNSTQNNQAIKNSEINISTTPSTQISNTSKNDPSTLNQIIKKNLLEDASFKNNTSTAVATNERKAYNKPHTGIDDAVTSAEQTTSLKTNNDKEIVANATNMTKEGIAENNGTHTESKNINQKEEKSYIKDPISDTPKIEKAITATEKNPDASKKDVFNDTAIEISENKKKSIFDAIQEKEETVIAETKSSKRWNIAPNIAPVYYDSFAGSSIDQEFSDNTKQGQVNLSYGVQVAYAINDKLTLRSGVNKVDVGYNTEDVGFGVSSVARGDSEANFGNVQNVVVSDFQNDQSFNVSNPPPSEINGEILVKSQNPGLLNHSIGYIEVPMELKYALTDSKIGIHMIGGVSTLFLEDENVTIIAGGFRNENVAREETVNNISFSGNVGIGFDYKLSDQFQINMEPIFKYQFNGFKENAENFKPYYFGIYTGVSFRF